MAKILFREEQKFSQPWFWLIIIPVLVGSLIFFGFGFHQQLIQNKPFGDNPMSDEGLIITAFLTVAFTIGITLLFYNMKLVVEIRNDGIHYRYPPLISKFRTIPRESIERLEVRKYKPLKEYGGWGIKTGSVKYGKAFNVRGNLGLQLYLISGHKILFGTQRKAAMQDAANKMMQAEDQPK
jgi:hypothetical protein